MPQFRSPVVASADTQIDRRGRPAGWLVKSFAWQVLIRRKAAGSGRRQAASMYTNRADPRLIWLVAVLTAMVVVVFLAQS